MKRNHLRRFVGILFVIFTLFYYFVDYAYGFEIICIIISVFSLLILKEGIQFKLKRHQYIALGEIEHFHRRYVANLLYYVLLAFFVFFGSKVLPPFRDEMHTLYGMLLVPGLLLIALRGFFKVKNGSIFATEKGLLYGMENQEFYFWEDFKSYKHIDSQKLFRIEKKNLKRLYISYEEEDFNKHREAILAILDKKLIKE